MIQTNNSLTCLVVDDHPLVCAAIKQLLNKGGLFETIIVEQDPIKAQKLIQKEKIEFIILDVNLVKSDGFELLRRIKSHGFNGKSLFISANDSRLYSETAHKLGADGYVCKSEDLNILNDAVECILNGYSFFKMIRDSGSNDVQLSKQELVVFTYLVDGKCNKEIASILSLSPKTISTYKSRILEKYNVKSIVELMSINKNII
ncbi:response regulator transcription factor [Vibrio plantisponsor]|jgi:DNA-binding NarL/FixJ family response regulator|uniref:Response regulator transcription factor n=1 Tax=Vibrio plantisponsor TaxID=664643 RepID=A0ABU4INI0_9VIBR|nr:response regulator transcription factor [Vibrio plantisponsor]MDW6020112.1 response regulator transcription factor [Vibrio plantisponsor]NNM40945.1 response regulator transcription factor [Vibrio plantisponsor]PNH88206.1 DNA-binding response regulator [Vibrio diazotrophicus]